MRLKEKVAIITGSAQGIGAAFAVGFAREGARIVVADLLNGENTLNAVKKQGSQAFFIETDVTSQDACDAMAKAAIERFGRIDILINNAAIFGNLVLRPFMEITTEEWNRVMAVNTAGPFHCIKAVFPYMKDKGGKIINISSGSFFEGVPGVPHYLASKGAIMAFSRGMARELGEFNINVNTLAPGFTHSAGGDRFDNNKALAIGPLEDILMPQRCIKRKLVPEDLVGTAIFLASNESDAITGQLILCDYGVRFN